jgi:hypothetical protein
VFTVSELEKSNSSSDRSDDSSGGNDDSSSDGEEKPVRSSESDSDATTASYSSLEDEEADGNDKHQRNDNADIGNGNNPNGTTPKTSSIAKLMKEMTVEPPVTISVSGGPNNEPASTTNQAFQSTSSDSESPTEPVSQPTIAQLRAKVVPGKAK